MISFFKKFLKPKEESIRFSELKQWLDNNNVELQKVKEKFKELESVKAEVSEKLIVLGNVDVSKAKAEDKVKNFVQGNLPAYINAINFFLKRIVIPEETDYVSLEIFCDSFEKEFEDLNKRTFRNFQIIRELVGKELEEVVKSVKKLELLVKEVKKGSTKIKNVAKVKEKADFIEDSMKNEERNKLRRDELRKAKEDLVNSCEKIKKEVKSLKCSKKAKDLERLEAEEKKISDNIKELEAGVTNLFSPLQKALKKYNNLCFIKKVNSYIENPVEALLNDSKLEILKFLKDVKKMVEEDKIDLKEDKKKKTVESLGKLDESFIKKFVENHASLKEELSSIKDDINSNTVLKEIEDLEKELNIRSFRIENTEREINKIKDVDVMAEVNELEKRLNEIFGYKIKVENVVG